MLGPLAVVAVDEPDESSFDPLCTTFLASPKSSTFALLLYSFTYSDPG